MSDTHGQWSLPPFKRFALVLLCCFVSSNALAEIIDGTGDDIIDGTGEDIIDGTGRLIIDGTGDYIIDGTGDDIIDGTGREIIDGTGEALIIDGTGRAIIDGTGDTIVVDATGFDIIDGTGRLIIDGTGEAIIIDGTGEDIIDGTGEDIIDGTGEDIIDGTGDSVIGPMQTRLLTLGRIDNVGDGFISVVGQTVVGSGTQFSNLTPGATVAVYGSIDAGNGSYADTSVVKLAPYGVDTGIEDFVRGTVDAVDSVLGIAIVSGITVDYTGLLATRPAPMVGEVVALKGKNYRNLGLFVAQP